MLFIVDLTPAPERQVIPWIRKIEDRVIYFTSDNKGYAHGINIGVRDAVSKGFVHFACVNTDIVFDRDFVEVATQTIIHHPRTIIGAKIYYAPGYEYHTKSKPIDNLPYPNVPNTYTIWFAGGNFDWAHATTSHIGVDTVDSEAVNQECETSFITGCCMLYDKSVRDIVGEWDETYFMYYEDADYCMRGKSKNIRCYYNPRIVIWHKNAQSSDGSGSSLQTHYMKKSQLRFALKYAPFRTKLHIVKNYLAGQR